MTMKSGNHNNPDAGYEHFHEHGRKAPINTQHGNSLPYRSAPNSGPGGLGGGGKPMGTLPDDSVSYPNVKPVGS